MTEKSPTLRNLIVPPLTTVGRPNIFTQTEWERLAKVLFRLRRNPPVITPCVDQPSIQFREARNAIENRVRRELTREGFDPRDWHIQAINHPRLAPTPAYGELCGAWELHLWCAGLMGPPKDAEPLVDPERPVIEHRLAEGENTLFGPIERVERETVERMKCVGCCWDGSCAADTCMDLGESTCADCVHEPRCTAMFGAKSENRYCQFFPRRFAAKGKAPVKPQNERVYWEPGVDEGVGDKTATFEKLVEADTKEAIGNHHARIGSVNGVEEAPPPSRPQTCPTCKGSGTVPPVPKHGEEAVKHDLDKEVVQEVVGHSVEHIIPAFKEKG